jgi:uncharacterized protein
MSREDVDIVRQGYDAYDRGDVVAALETFHPDVEWKQVEQPREVRGRDAVLSVWEEWSEPFEENLHANVEDLEDLGEGQVLAVVRHTGVGKQSGIKLDMTTYLLYTVRDERVVRMVEYLERDQALRAATATGSTG